MRPLYESHPSGDTGHLVQPPSSEAYASAAQEAQRWLPARKEGPHALRAFATSQPMHREAGSGCTHGVT